MRAHGGDGRADEEAGKYRLEGVALKQRPRLLLLPLIVIVVLLSVTVPAMQGQLLRYLVLEWEQPRDAPYEPAEASAAWLL